jgi:hypothetical protein
MGGPRILILFGPKLHGIHFFSSKIQSIYLEVLSHKYSRERLHTVLFSINKDGIIKKADHCRCISKTCKILLQNMSFVIKKIYCEFIKANHMSTGIVLSLLSHFYVGKCIFMLFSMKLGFP